MLKKEPTGDKVTTKRVMKIDCNSAFGTDDRVNCCKKFPAKLLNKKIGIIKMRKMAKNMDPINTHMIITMAKNHEYNKPNETKDCIT